MRIGPEQLAPVNGIEIAYQEFGDPDGEPMLMTMGLGTQMIAWDEGFCRLLVEKGFRVVRFDNRDIGHSSWLDHLGAPGRAPMLLGLHRGLAYSLDDMADDLAGLIGHLGLESAHVVGASQGGMIAQVLAYRRPELVRSLGLIMTGAGKRISALPRLRALGTLLAEPPPGRDAYIGAVTRTFEVIGSPAYPPDPERLRELIAAGYDRAHHPVGAGAVAANHGPSGGKRAPVAGRRRIAWQDRRGSITPVASAAGIGCRRHKAARRRREASTGGRVFASFILNGDPTVKQFGVGLAVAIAVDATIVRCLLVPATMVLLGRSNWWIPGWLDRILPNVGLESEESLPEIRTGRTSQ